MESEPENTGQSFVDELIQPEAEHAEPKPKPKDNFLPWHKPRKHWIRRNQWAAGAVDLINRLGLGGQQRPLNYISLPGPDMLDVRAIHHACASVGAQIQFLGFMTGEDSERTELNISLDEVLSLPGVSSESTVLLDALQSLADPKSVGYAKAEQYGPYDIINIDLCKSVGGAPPLDQQAGCYAALQRIIELQRRKRPPEQPWLLFLTTRGNMQSVQADARAAFFDCLIRNVEKHEDIVRPALQDGLGITPEQLALLGAGTPPAGVNFEPAFAAAVGKWILQLLGVAPAGTLSLLPTSCFYGIRNPGMNDMISLGFLCQTIVAPAADPSGLAPAGVPQQIFPTEPEAAATMIRLVQQMQNVDVVLGQDSGTYAQAVEDAAEFMGTARFDIAAYRIWALRSKEAPKETQIKAPGQ